MNGNGNVNTIQVRLTPRRTPAARYRLWRARRMVRRVERTSGWSSVKVDRTGRVIEAQA